MSIGIILPVAIDKSFLQANHLLCLNTDHLPASLRVNDKKHSSFQVRLPILNFDNGKVRITLTA